MTNGQYQRQRIKQYPDALIAQLRRAILVYACQQGTTVDRAASDALVDIRHLCDIWRLDFDALDDDSYEGYMEELEYSQEPRQ